MTKQEQVAHEAKRLRSTGLSWLAIGNMLGVSNETVRFAADPDYAERRRQANTQRKRGLYVPKKNHVPDYRPPAEDAHRAIELAQARAREDTRTPLQRAFGDPPPGRSALDQKRAGAKQGRR